MRFFCLPGPGTFDSLGQLSRFEDKSSDDCIEDEVWKTGYPFPIDSPGRPGAFHHDYCYAVSHTINSSIGISDSSFKALTSSCIRFFSSLLLLMSASSSNSVELSSSTSASSSSL